MHIQIISTYKGQTRTDTDKTDKTRQENVSYGMSLNRKAKDSQTLRDLITVAL